MTATGGSAARSRSAPAPRRHRTIAARKALARHRRLLAAVFAAVATGLGLSVLRPSPPSSTEILAAARDLPAGTVLRPADLRPVALPAGLAPDGSVGSRAARPATGRVLSGPMRRGELLTDARLLHGGLLKGYGDGVVATPIRVADAGVARLLRPGDRVDVLVAGEPPGPPAAIGTDEPGFAPAPVPAAESQPEPEPTLEPGRGKVRRGRIEPGDLPVDLLPVAGGARRIATAVQVITVPRVQAGLAAGDGALIVLATDRTQAAALTGARGQLSITVVAGSRPS